MTSFCLHETDDNGEAGLQLLHNNLTGCRFAFSCQIVAKTAPFSLLYCHCFDSPGFNFRGTGGSPLFSFLFDICEGKYFEIDLTVPQPKSPIPNSFSCNSTLLKSLSKYTCLFLPLNFSDNFKTTCLDPRFYAIFRRFSRNVLTKS